MKKNLNLVSKEGKVACPNCGTWIDYLLIEYYEFKIGEMVYFEKNVAFEECNSVHNFFEAYSCPECKKRLLSFPKGCAEDAQAFLRGEYVFSGEHRFENSYGQQFKCLSLVPQGEDSHGQTDE